MPKYTFTIDISELTDRSEFTAANGKRKEVKPLIVSGPNNAFCKSTPPLRANSGIEIAIETINPSEKFINNKAESAVN